MMRVEPHGYLNLALKYIVYKNCKNVTTHLDEKHGRRVLVVAAQEPLAGLLYNVDRRLKKHPRRHVSNPSET